MAELTIRIFPDSFLRKKAKEVSRVGDAEKRMLDEMASAMYLNKGVGLAAIQVGIDKQLAVVDVGEGLIKLINPTLVKRDGSETTEEGCLSVPGAAIKVKRAKSVLINFLDENGEVKQLRAEGLLARALQHEMDHLAGRLIVDYANPIRKLILSSGLSGKRAPRKRAS